MSYSLDPKLVEVFAHTRVIDVEGIGEIEMENAIARLTENYNVAREARNYIVLFDAAPSEFSFAALKANLLDKLTDDFANVQEEFDEFQRTEYDNVDADLAAHAAFVLFARYVEAGCEYLVRFLTQRLGPAPESEAVTPEIDRRMQEYDLVVVPASPIQALPRAFPRHE